MATEDGMLHAGGKTGFERLVVTTQLRLTVPVKPFEGVTLIVEVLPVVAPGFTVMFPLLVIAKPACAETAVTVTSTTPTSLTLPQVPVTSTT